MVLSAVNIIFNLNHKNLPPLVGNFIIALFSNLDIFYEGFGRAPCRVVRT